MLNNLSIIAVNPLINKGPIPALALNGNVIDGQCAINIEEDFQGGKHTVTVIFEVQSDIPSELGNLRSVNYK